MSIADPRLLAIRDALVARLQGITKANGYHFDIGTIGTSFKQIGEITNFPAALVWTFLTRERKAERNSDSRSAILSAPIVGMTLYVKSGDPGTDALKFAQDVVAAIEAQPRDLDLVDSSVRYVTASSPSRRKNLEITRSRSLTSRSSN